MRFLDQLCTHSEKDSEINAMHDIKLAVKWVSFIPAAYRRNVIRAAQEDSAPVFLSGETGSGKSAIARWIHQNSPRSAKPYVVFAGGENLAEKIRQADEGTLVISELKNLNPSETEILYHFLRYRSFSDPGQGGVRRLARTRVIAMGNEPLSDISEWYLLFKSFHIPLPPLNRRQAELEEIIQSLFVEMAHELQKDHVRDISSDAKKKLMSHQWRANLRELRNVLRYAILRAEGSQILVSHLPNLEDPEGILLKTRAEFKKIEESLLSGERGSRLS